MEKKKILILSALIAALLVLLLVALLIPKNSSQTPDPTVESTEPSQAATAAPTEESTEEPSEATTEEATQATLPDSSTIRNPLNGSLLEAKYDGRIFAVSINNSKSALPFHGVSQADILFEMYVNEYATRCMALFSNVAEVESIGSIRSTRYNFTDISLAYDCIMSHASCSEVVRKDMIASGIDQMNVDGAIGYRDYKRYNNQGYAWEHCLFAQGSELVSAAAKKGFALSKPDRDYGLNFVEDATPPDGRDAQKIDIVFTIGGHKKTSTMQYDETTGKYIFWQYNKKMTDQNNGADVAFTNVIVMLAKNTNEGIYHIADLSGQGEGYFACGGKIVPIYWIHKNETDPFTFYQMDGTPLSLGVGTTYIAIAPTGSPINY